MPTILSHMISTTFSLLASFPIFYVSYFLNLWSWESMRRYKVAWFIPLYLSINSVHCMHCARFNLVSYRSHLNSEVLVCTYTTYFDTRLKNLTPAPHVTNIRYDFGLNVRCVHAKIQWWEQFFFWSHIKSSPCWGLSILELFWDISTEIFLSGQPIWIHQFEVSS